jgi:hypothetical protein
MAARSRLNYFSNWVFREFRFDGETHFSRWRTRNGSRIYPLFTVRARPVGQPGAMRCEFYLKYRTGPPWHERFKKICKHLPALQQGCATVFKLKSTSTGEIPRTARNDKTKDAPTERIPPLERLVSSQPDFLPRPTSP